MDSLPHLLEPLAAYPRWLVVVCGVLAAVVVVWVLAKLAKWALILVVAAAVVLGVLLVVSWLLG
jgi:hypothetical protein